MDDVIVYSEGLCYASVCTALGDAETAAQLPASGTRGGWALADEPFNGGGPNPGPCNTHPETRRHLLFVC